ncbi:Aste57867_5827 [Aphanomyces stellatus]|uniref:Aste57867_5827 protein n=1 Tax=Aphanomyces stellatus TaxID=120398 RepID=A0A485KHJ4_9STRA|nr:hypothetical protein As57867_005813 [Aphanomyces stellatus]VFT82850.1 Aste57867_5827 [Aphanomyces stellatus]
MDRFVPVPDEMEEQTLSQEVLYAHVTARSVQLCAAVASFGTLASIPFMKEPALPIVPRVLRNNFRAVTLGLFLGPFMTYGRMRGMDVVEWKDRSWRLLQNPGQNNVDIALTAGSVVCGLAAVVGMKAPQAAAVRFLGGVGIGSFAGLGLLAFLPADKP